MKEAIKLVFLYGNTMIGMPHHKTYIENSKSKFLGKDRISGKYSMVSLGSTPGIVLHDEGETSIMGEVWKVTNTTLEELDVYEGCFNDPDFNFSNKIIVKTSYGNAYMYVIDKEFLENNYKVLSGDWREFCIQREALNKELNC